MSTITFTDEPIQPRFVVITGYHDGQWVFVRHRERSTWEIPGGHIEEGETILEAARRELWEETGCICARFYSMGGYSVNRDGSASHGALFFAVLQELEGIPSSSEIAERCFDRQIPGTPTYPQIQPHLFRRAQDWLTEHVATVYFIRHAEPDLSVRDDLSRPLTPKGHADAKALAEQLSGVTFDAIYASPCKRAVDTVMPLVESWGLSVEVVHDFREREIGMWVEDFDTYAKAQWNDFDYSIENGESLATVQERNLHALRQLLSKWAGKTIAIGTHGTALSTILHHFDPSFGYADFRHIAPVTPYVVRMELLEDLLLSKQESDTASMQKL